LQIFILDHIVSRFETGAEKLKSPTLGEIKQQMPTLQSQPVFKKIVGLVEVNVTIAKEIVGLVEANVIIETSPSSRSDSRSPWRKQKSQI
jgi:hypothetical protein